MKPTNVITRRDKVATAKIGTFEGTVYWARFFLSNKDDSEFHEKTEGQYNCVFIPKDDAELDRLMKMGFPPMSMGRDMVKEYETADGPRKGVKLKRPHKHPKIDDFGGPPVVMKGIGGEFWDLEKDGDIGNVSKVAVKVTIFGEGSTATVRLEKVAVLELVPHVKQEYEDMGW